MLGVRQFSRVSTTLAILCMGCKDEPGSWEVETKATTTAPAKANVVKTPVPYGSKVACSRLLDEKRLSEHLGREVTLSDQSQSDAEATSVCQVKLAGKPPSAKEQERMWLKNNRVLGVMPGDEICQVTIYCSFLFDPAEVRKKCEAAGETVSTELGDLMCTKAIEAGDKYRHVVSVLDTDSKCKVVIHPGPSVTDEATVRQCAEVATELVSPATIQ